MSEGTQTTYDAIAIEAKWQQRWAEEGTNTFSADALHRAQRPFYNLMMYPYPSAEGLHVGNVYAFTGADVYGRWKRLQGEDVFEPIGFDAFGIHSENYALKVGTHPMELIPRNIENFRRQLKRSGAMYDWQHTVDTTDPRYYRWTQWIFLQLYKAGLAERKVAPVNWCPSCHTVLANEQVIAGECERCGTLVEQRFLAQWFFKITRYAERLLANLSWIDWSDTTKRAQENWIGKSEGALIRFPLVPAPKRREGDTATRRAGDRENAASPRPRVAQSGDAAGGIDVFTTRPDTLFGATFMVLAPEHPLVDAVTAPEHRAVVDTYRSRIASLDLVTRRKTEKGKTGIFTGGYCLNPATGEEIPIWIADYVLMEYGTGAIMAVPGHDDRDFEFATRFALPIRRVVAGEPEHEGTPLHQAYTGAGVLVNSGQFNGMKWDEGGRAIVAWLEAQGLAEPRVHYRLHDWCISRQRYWGPPIPIIHCGRCGTVPVPESELPVVLPYIENYKPDESGVSPLARVAQWYRVPCPQCGGEARRETDVSDTFLDSAWYFLRYASTDRDDVPFDPELTRKWLPVDIYIGGEEHAVLHLLYSRFITMALHDLGYLEFEEPYLRFRKHGLIIRDGAKMSKSRGNVVIPDEYLERYGADTLRTYLMFLGPYQEGGDFRDQGIQGPHGFLSRLWDTVVPVGELGEEPVSAALEQKLHATMRKVTEDIAGLRYNTAIAALMEYLNAVREGGRRANRAEIEPLVRLVAPFAPHLAEELWQQLGGKHSLFQEARWPEYDPEKATADTVEFVVQVNGRVRARIPVRRGLAQDEARAAALTDENVRRFLDGNPIRKVIFVPDRLINLVV
ncbi:MAG: leucine--tRNA ligase [Gemmatimonadetes bacterium]|nr:leucine--tRNA ligase [Gemmatimonadota bacterium]